MWRWMTPQRAVEGAREGVVDQKVEGVGPLDPWPLCLYLEEEVGDGVAADPGGAGLDHS